MYPTNQYMDPYYSHYRNHGPYPYYPPLGWEACHPRAMDSSYWSPSYGPWTYNAGMNPPDFHCCCNHSYAPGYYGFRPPFPQELPPHPYYHGPSPKHPNEYPSYFVPPHPHPVQQTPYDYMSKSHCCGCPNHVCHGGERGPKSNVKIEEERPDKELKDSDNSGAICHSNNNQYPVIWLPSGNTEEKENGRLYELPPHLLNGWVPVGGKREEDAKQQGQNDRKEKQFQWPMVWMPAAYDEPKQKTNELKEKGENSKITEETPSPKIKIIPVSWFGDQKPAANSGSRDHSETSAVESQPTTAEHRDGDGVAGEGHHKTTPVVPRRVNDERELGRANHKTIPVLPEKETDEKKVVTYRTIPVMTQEESDEKKSAATEQKEEKKASSAEKEGQNGRGNHTTSTTAKHSKLPPVCLRLDPLPRKKSGNGSSRSPSPPTRKDADKSKEDMDEAQSQNLEPKQSDTKQKKENSPEEFKKGMGFSNGTVPAASANSQEEEVPTSDDHQKVQASSTSFHAQENAGADIEGGGTQENAGAETLKGGEKSTDRGSKKFRAKFSEADAAVRIQSAYRGYDVRRWQPLDKLRKIRGVHEQMQDTRTQLQSLEASSMKPTEKEQVAIGEAIMNLLLKLDTIQGLRPCVRDARKSVARELICLQEKLDSLCKQPSGEFNNTNEDERLDRAESVIHTAAPTAEASDNEEKAIRPSEAKEKSPVNSMELCDAIPSEVSMEMQKDTYPSELKNQKEQPCTRTMEVPHEEGKAAEQIGFQGVSSTDLMRAASLPEHPLDNHERQMKESLPEHPHDNHEHQMKESNADSLETNKERKIVVTDERQEMPLVESTGPLHDAAPTVVSSGQENYMASTERSFHAEESNSGFSPAVTRDIKATTATESLDNELAADNDGSVEDQTREAVGVEGPEQKHDVSPVEEAPNVILEDAEAHKHDPTTAADLVTCPEETKNMNMQEQVADSTQDSTKEPDGTPEVSMHDIEPAASEDPTQVALLEPTSESDSVPEQTVLEESNSAMQSELSDKENVPHVDQNNEVLEPTGGELDVQENNPSVAEGAETILPELNSLESSCEDAITGYDMPEMKLSRENPTSEQNEGVQSSCADAQSPKADESTDVPKQAPSGVMGANSVEHVDVRVSGTEEEANNLKEDVSVQTESMALEESLSASATPDAVKDSDEKKLVEENQRLRALLQKLLASGNDQMEVITDLSEKVKVLERKLARKKKPKVRVHRPAAIAKVH